MIGTYFRRGLSPGEGSIRMDRQPEATSASRVRSRSNQRLQRVESSPTRRLGPVVDGARPRHESADDGCPALCCRSRRHRPQCRRSASSRSPCVSAPTATGSSRCIGAAQHALQALGPEPAGLARAQRPVRSAAIRQLSPHGVDVAVRRWQRLVDSAAQFGRLICTSRVRSSRVSHAHHSRSQGWVIRSALRLKAACGAATPVVRASALRTAAVATARG